MTDREAAIRAKLRSVNVETLPPDDLEYASDLDWLLAELAAAREREQELREALERIATARPYAYEGWARGTARAALDAAGGQE